jgi:hypothetical protein
MILTIKWVLASIPAFILLWLLGMVAMTLVWGLMGGVMDGPWRMR